MRYKRIVYKYVAINLKNGKPRIKQTYCGW